MNSLVYLRQLEVESLDQYRAGVTSFLGTNLFRERWLGIYKKNRKIGYSGATFEKVFAAEGIEMHSVLESKMDLELLGRAFRVELDGTLVLDANMKPTNLQVDALFEGTARLTLSGHREGEQFVLTVKQGAFPIFRLPLHLEELCLGNGLVPSLPVAGFRVGDVYRVPCFDPITLGRGIATVTVVSKKTREVDGLAADVFCLETSFQNVQSKSWVTGTGELLKQELGPPFEDVILRRETRESARRFFKR
jgi:hypothetical protein